MYREMKIASVKKKIPWIANGSPKRSISPGHRSPSSNESTVPVTAPTANSTAITLDHRCASLSAVSSSLRRPHQLATSVIAGKPIPMQAKTMWNPSVNAICSRARSRSETARMLTGRARSGPVVHGRGAIRPGDGERALPARPERQRHEPAQQRDEAISPSHQVGDVDHRPRQQRGATPELDAERVHDRAVAADHRHRALVAVLEPRRGVTPPQASPGHP